MTTQCPTTDAYTACQARSNLIDAWLNLNDEYDEFVWNEGNKSTGYRPKVTSDTRLACLMGGPL